MKRRSISFILALLLIVSAVPQLAQNADAASTYRINGVNVHYTNFATSPNECWMYANNFYYRIWGTYFANNFDDPSNMLRNLSDSDLKLTASHLKAYVTSAKPGAVLRICDAYYLHSHDGWGHSQLIVQIDDKGFTVFEGGLGTYPYCREKYYTWSEYVNTWSYPYIKYIKFPGAPKYSNVITKSYPANCTIEVAVDTAYVKSLPCTKKANSASTNLEEPVKGTKYHAIGLVVNQSGSLWYKVKTKTSTDSSVGYVYSGYMTYLNDRISDIKAVDVTMASSIAYGNPFNLTGTVKTSYNKLTGVSAYVHAGATSQGQIETGTAVSVSKNSYALSGSPVDNKTEFNKLPVGLHTYVVSASYKNYYVDDSGKLCSNSGTRELFAATFRVIGDAASCQHAYSTFVIAEPTCVTDGSMTYVCDLCGDGYNEAIAATGVCTYFGEVTADADCVHDGIITHTCSGCGDSYTETIPSSGQHSYTQQVTAAPDCENDGAAAHTCSGCGDSYTETIPATGHTYGEWETVVDATCTAGGSEERVCAACSHAETHLLDAHGLTYVDAVEPTRNTTGNIAHWMCQTCSRYYVDSEGTNEIPYESTILVLPAYSTTSNGSIHALSRLWDDEVRLMDGSWSNADIQDTAYSAWHASEVEILVDLGTEKTVNNFCAYAAYGFWGVQAPDRISVQYSTDGVTYYDYIADSLTENIAQGLVAVSVSGESVSARYIRITVCGNGEFIWLDEIQINEAAI